MALPLDDETQPQEMETRALYDLPPLLAMVSSALPMVSSTALTMAALSTALPMAAWPIACYHPHPLMMSYQSSQVLALWLGPKYS